MELWFSISIMSLLIIIIILLLIILSAQLDTTQRLIGIRKDVIKITFYTMTAIRVSGESGFSSTIGDIEKKAHEFIESDRDKWE